MINTTFLTEILRDYSVKRNNAITQSELNQKNALSIKEYNELDKKERALVFEIGKSKFEQKDCSALLKQLDVIKQEKQKVLKIHHIKPSDLVPKFECKKCQDTGFVNNKICSCLKQEYNNRLMQNSGLKLENVGGLNDYDCSIFGKNKAQMQNIVDNLKQFVENFEHGKIKNLVLVGETGVGKTYLTQSIAKDIILNGYTVLFTTSFALNNAFLKAHTSKNVDKMLELGTYIEPDLVIIDDFGTEPMIKNVTKEYYLLLLNERILKNKHTIFTTNMMPDNILDTYKERIFSRMFDKSNSVLINLGGKDLRISKK